MKKSVIAYAVSAVVLGILLIALGIFFEIYDPTNQILENHTSSIFLFFLYLPILFIEIIFICFIIFGVPYLLSGLFALLALFSNELISLKKNLRVFSVIGGILLTITLIIDIVVLNYVIENIEKGVSPLLIAFMLLLTAAAIAIEVTSIIAQNKVKLKIMQERL